MYPSKYLEIPQEEWDELALTAEEVLPNSGHSYLIVATFPCGGRLFGLDVPPQILCLYLDNPINLLDPTYFRDLECTRLDLPLEFSNIGITFINLFTWLSWITIKRPDQAPNAAQRLFHMIPCETEPLNVDLEVSVLFEMIRKFAQVYRYGPSIKTPYMWNLHTALFCRTDAIMSATGQFLPNINPNYGNVFDLSTITDNQDILNADKTILENHELDEKALKSYGKNLLSLADCHRGNLSQIRAPRRDKELAEVSRTATNFFKRLT